MKSGYGRREKLGVEDYIDSHSNNQNERKELLSQGTDGRVEMELREVGSRLVGVLWLCFWIAQMGVP